MTATEDEFVSYFFDKIVKDVHPDLIGALTNKARSYYPEYVARKKSTNIKSLKEGSLGWCNRFCQMRRDMFPDLPRTYGKIYYISRGWDEADAKNKVKIRQESRPKRKINSPFTLKYWVNKGYSEKDAEVQRRSCIPVYEEYWVKRGCSKSEAEQKAIFTKTDNNKRGNEGQNKDKKYTRLISKRCFEYWESRYPEEIAREKYREYQTNFSLETCIQKYGNAEGQKVFDKRQEQWQNTLKAKPQEEIDRMNRLKNVDLINCIKKYGEEVGEEYYYVNIFRHSNQRYRWFYKVNAGDWKKAQVDYENDRNEHKKHHKGSASKESLEILLPMYRFVRQLGIPKDEIFIGTGKSKELIILSVTEGRSRYSYDFAVESNKMKFIIEYHGKVFHAKESYPDDWLAVFSKTTKQESLRMDAEKERRARDCGYDYYVVWSDENKSSAISRLKQEIKDTYENNNR